MHPARFENESHIMKIANRDTPVLDLHSNFETDSLGFFRVGGDSLYNLAYNVSTETHVMQIVSTACKMLAACVILEVSKALK